MNLAKKMSVNRKLSGLNGRLPPTLKSWKTNEALCGSNSVRKFRRKSFFVWIFGLVAMGSMFYFLSFNRESLMKSGKKSWDGCEERTRIFLQHYNFSKKRLHALDSLLSGSDQVLCFSVF